MDVLWTSLWTHIPYEEVAIKKSSHPWLNEKCQSAISAKKRSEGQADFEQKRKECSQALAEEYQGYLSQLKTKIAKLEKGSKEW